MLYLSLIHISTLSHHMKILCDSGIVEGKKAGKWAHYSISQQGVAAAQELLAGLTINDLTDRQGCSCRASSGGICVQGKTKLYVLTGFLGSGKTTIPVSYTHLDVYKRQ